MHGHMNIKKEYKKYQIHIQYVASAFRHTWKCTSRSTTELPRMVTLQ